jgi:hypothetical protein
MGVFETFLSALAILIPILGIGIIALIIFFIVKHKDQNPETSFSPKNLLRIYIYFMLIVTLAASTVSTATLLNSIFATNISYQFSYQFNTYSEPYYNPTYDSSYDSSYYKDPNYNQPCYSGDPISVEGNTYCFDINTVKRDMVSGLTLAISMVVLFGIHFAGLVLINKEEVNMLLSKVYSFVSLLGYGIVSVIAIPTAIYQLINYWAFPATDLADYSRAIPGQALSIALLATPIWIFFLYKAIKMSTENNVVNTVAKTTAVTTEVKKVVSEKKVVPVKKVAKKVTKTTKKSK